MQYSTSDINSAHHADNAAEQAHIDAANPTPDLEHNSGSWIVVCKETGNPVAELYRKSTVDRVNRKSYIVYTALAWLVECNRKIKARRY